MRRLVIAIDGPAGAGKSTVAKMVSKELGYTYIDTGAMYRAVTLSAIRKGLDPSTNQVEIANLADNIKIEFVPNPDGEARVYLDGEDVTSDIRTPEIDQKVALVAMIPGVRRAMVSAQRQMAAGGGAVLEGRDTGTHVVPDADRKFYLHASESTRSERRFRQFNQVGHSISMEEVRRGMDERDRLDSNRSDSPLASAPDAVIVDTTNMSVDQVVRFVLSYCQQEGGHSDL